MPVTPSPSVLRSARILSELALRPHEDATLTDLARRLGIHKTSCQTLILALVEAGLVSRGPRRTYHLGPGLIPLGDAARAALRIPADMTAQLEELSAEFGVTSLAGQRAGLEIVVVAVHEVADPLGLTIPLGQRMPLQAPFGSLYVAWDADAEIAAWIDRATPPVSGDERAEMLAALQLVRRRGCSLTVRRPTQSGSGAVPHTAIDVVEARQTTMELPEQTRPDSAWTLLSVQAPVFDRGGELLCTVAVTGFPYPLVPAAIGHIADRVLASASTMAVGVAASDEVRRATG